MRSVCHLLLLSWLLTACETNEFKDSTTFDPRDWELNTHYDSVEDIEALLDGSWSLRHSIIYQREKSLVRNFNYGEVIWSFDDGSKEVFRESRDDLPDPYELGLEPVDPQITDAPLVPVILIAGDKGFLTIEGNKMVISYGYLALPNYYFERYD